MGLVLSVVPLFLLFRYLTGSTGLSAFLAVIMLIAGFLFSAVASYMAGLVGSSNNPISGVTIATILATALLLVALGTDSATGPAVAILVGAVVCCAAAIGGDNLQDLKTGHIVGATPWKQQVMQIVGVIAAAVVIAPLLSALKEAYGLGASGDLPAPQATLMAEVAKGVFDGGLPWEMVIIGMAVAVGVIVLDLVLASLGSKFRTPVLAVAVGIYLPLELSVPIFAGGMIAWAAARASKGVGRGGISGGPGLLFAAGLITGEALAGIALAIVIVITGSENPLDLRLDGRPLPWPGVIVLAAVMGMLFWTTVRDSKSER